MARNDVESWTSLLATFRLIRYTYKLLIPTDIEVHRTKQNIYIYISYYAIVDNGGGAGSG